MWAYPLGEKSIPYIDFRWPSRNITHLPVLKSQSRPNESNPLQKQNSKCYDTSFDQILLINASRLPRDCEWPINLEGHTMHCLAVTLLMQNFLFLLQIPQSPWRIVAAGAQKASRGMIGYPRYSMIVSRNIRLWLITRIISSISYNHSNETKIRIKGESNV